MPRPRELSFRHQGTTLGNVSIGIIEYSTPAHIDIADLTHSYSIGLPLRGAQSFELQSSMDESCRKRLARLSRQAIESKLAQLLMRQLSRPVVFDPRMPLSGMVQGGGR